MSSHHGLRFWSIIIAILATHSACSLQPVDDKPSSIINLDNWKLSVPDANNDGGNPSQIQQPELHDYSSPYMFVASGRKEVVFHTPAHSPSQPGSDYPRTELREMTNDGQSEAKWSSRGSTHTLSVEQAVTVVPSTNPAVVIGQIHDSKEFVVLVRLDGEHLYAKTHDGEMDTLDDHYRLGTFFSLKIIAGDGNISVYYNGSPKTSYKKKCSSCYFKAGLYLQTNADLGEGAESFGEVRIRSLDVSHS